MLAELGPMGQALMSGVRAIKDKKKTDEESQGLLSSHLSTVSILMVFSKHTCCAL